MLRTILWLVVGFWAASGCTGSDDSSVDEPSLGGEGSEGEMASPEALHPLVSLECERTCEDEENACRNEFKLDCTECYASCASAGTCVSCARICSDYTICHGICRDPTSCYSRGYVFHFDEVAAEVGAACRVYYSHVKECGVEVYGDPCETFERVERADVVQRYECFASADCESDATADCEPPKTGLVEEFCGRLDQCHEGCTDDMRQKIEYADGWLRPEVIDAGLSCLELATCGSQRKCVQDWIDAVTH